MYMHNFALKIAIKTKCDETNEVFVLNDWMVQRSCKYAYMDVYIHIYIWLVCLYRYIAFVGTLISKLICIKKCGGANCGSHDKWAGALTDSWERKK